MIVDRKFPRSAEELVEFVRRETIDSKIVVIQAGHFLLYYHEAQRRLIPTVEAGTITENNPLEFSGFPIFSWKLGCRLLEGLPDVSCYLSVLVNDWQHVPSGLERKHFYAEFPQLPSTYIDEIRASRSAKVMLLTSEGPADFTANRPYFSERRLRNQYDRRMEKLIKKNALPEGVELNFSDHSTVCTLSGVVGMKRQIYHSSEDADCSNEIAELIDEVYALVRCDTFINLYPAICKPFVEPGSELPSRLFGTPISRVINLALPSAGIASESDLLDGAEMAIHHF